MSLIDAGELRALDALARSWDRAGPIVFDVGANRGDYTAEVLERFDDPRIFCFEPQASAYDALEERFADDSISSPARVTLFRCGLSNRRGAATLRSTVNEACVLATLSERDRDTYDPDVKLAVSERVRLYTLDEIADGLCSRIDMLKIDTEGHELGVLQGGPKALGRASLVQFEFNACAAAAGVRFWDLWMLLHERFHLYRLETTGEVSAVPEYHSRHEEPLPQRNYLAVAHGHRFEL
jgi:FkbM family methyltransferase